LRDGEGTTESPPAECENTYQECRDDFVIYH